MQDSKRTYETPVLKSWGAVAEVTQAACIAECFNGSVYNDIQPR